MSIEHPLLTLKEAATMLRCSKAHLSNVVNGKVRGLPSKLPIVQLGRRKLIRRDALDQWVKTVERSAGQ